MPPLQQKIPGLREWEPICWLEIQSECCYTKQKAGGSGHEYRVPFVKTRQVTTARDMFEAAREALPETDILIKAAAVADYRPAQVAEDKIKKKDGDMSIPLERTDDILGWVAENRHPGLFVCGFSMETKDMVENSVSKLQRKKLDMIAANNLKLEGAGFGVETNVITIITREGITELPLMGKDQAAAALLDAIEQKRS